MPCAEDSGNEMGNKSRFQTAHDDKMGWVSLGCFFYYFGIFLELRNNTGEFFYNILSQLKHDTTE
jgi:hypothetical protein